VTVARAARLASGGFGLGLVLGALTVVPPDTRWQIGGLGAIGVVLAALSIRLTPLVSWVLVVLILGVAMAADSGRVPVPTAAVLGLLALGYLALAELAEELDDREPVGQGHGTGEPGGQPAERGERPYVVEVAGWLRAAGPLPGAALVGAVVLAVAVVLPVPAGVWLVVGAPLALVLGVGVALRRPGASPQAPEDGGPLAPVTPGVRPHPEEGDDQRPS
jgi:hypothetical protein